MALGPGALSLLLQPSHVQNPASGTGIFRGAQLMQDKKKQAWYQGQREAEFDEDKRRFGVETKLKGAQFGLDVEKFEYGKQETRRLEKAKAWDELLEADASQDPQKMLAAWRSAQLRGIQVPGYEEKLNALFGSDDNAATTAAEKPTQAPTMSAEDKSIDAGLEKVKQEHGIRGPLVGESIGDGWEVVETPPEAKVEAPPERSPFTGQVMPEIGPPQGLAGGLRAPAPRAPEAPPGTLVAYDEDTGRPIGTVNPETAMARSRARVREGLSALVENASTPAEKRAAAIAMDTGQRLVGTMSVDKIVENAQKRYDKELGRDTAKSVARGGREAGEGGLATGMPPDDTMYERAGRTPEEIRAIKTIGDYVHTKIIQKAQQVHNTKELQRVAGTARSVASKVAGTKGFAQRQAIRDILRMTEGARQTDADLDYALSGDGALGQLHMKLNEYVAGGTLPHNFKQQISDYATLLEGMNRERQKKAAAYAREFALKDPTLRDMVGEEDLANWAEQAARGAMGEAIGAPKRAAPKGGGDSEVDSLVEELEGAR